MQGRDLYFASGDARLRYRDDGEGPPVVFIHGWTLDLDAWEPQAALAPSMRVIRYDRRGFGLSGGTPGRAADADDLARLRARRARLCAAPSRARAGTGARRSA
jgi:non-heme chloroperoxidase